MRATTLERLDFTFTPYLETKVLDERPYVTRGTCIRVARNPARVEVQTDRKRVSHSQRGDETASLLSGRTIDSLVVIPRRLSWRL